MSFTDYINVTIRADRTNLELTKAVMEKSGIWTLDRK
jgi:hypothetical protein